MAPKEHGERVVDDFTEDEHAELRRVVHRVGRAVCSAVPTERLYVLTSAAHRATATSTGTSLR